MLHAYLMISKYIIMCRTHSTYVTAVMKSYQDPLKPEQTTQFLFQLKLRGSVGVRIQDRIQSPFARSASSLKECIILKLSHFSSTLKERREIKEKRENRAKRRESKGEKRERKEEREARREREKERSWKREREERKKKREKTDRPDNTRQTAQDN